MPESLNSTEIVLPSKGSEFDLYSKSRSDHWDAVAGRKEKRQRTGKYYHDRLTQLFKSMVPPGHRVLEIGCGKGDLLAALEPSSGFGVDFSREMVTCASARYPHLSFIYGDAHDLPIRESHFDTIILSDLVNDIWDVQKVFEQVARFSNTSTRIIVNFYSKLWELPLRFAQRIGIAAPAMPQNWLTVEDVSNLFHMTGFEVIHRRDEILWPVSTPLIDVLCNRFFVKVWPFRMFALTHLMVARYKGIESKDRQETGVSIIIPARNEAGNIRRIIERTPEMGNVTELIFVEGHSTDNTYATIEKEIALHPHRSCVLLRQTGTGKGEAVRLGFQEAKGETLMILDADMTVAPEDLPKFYEALRSGVGEFINGVRLVYPMEGEAMRFFNLAGNKFFSLAFSWLLGQPIKDTLCGTKVLSKKNYLKIADNRACFGEFDPFGDFDLLFGAAKLNLKIVELPVRYGKRIYGTTNIQRWKHGWLLLRMVIFAARKFKFS